MQLSSVVESHLVGYAGRVPGKTDTTRPDPGYYPTPEPSTNPAYPDWTLDNTMLSENVNNNISAVLRYASRHWTHHLPPLPYLTNADNLCSYVSEFLQIHVLFWIE